MFDSVNTAKHMYKEWMTTGKNVSTNLREVVYYAAIRYGGASEWDFMFNKYLHSTVATEKQMLMFSLAETSDADILQKYLKMTLNKKIIKTQDTCYIINKVANNPIGRKMAYLFLNKNWSEFVKRYDAGSNFRDWVQLFNGVLGTGKTGKDLMRASLFLEMHPGGAKLASEQAVADILNHITWLKRNEKVVVEWLKKNMGNKLEVIG